MSLDDGDTDGKRRHFLLLLETILAPLGFSGMTEYTMEMSRKAAANTEDEVTIGLQAPN